MVNSDEIDPCLIRKPWLKWQKDHWVHTQVVTVDHHNTFLRLQVEDEKPWLFTVNIIPEYSFTFDQDCFSSDEISPQKSAITIFSKERTWCTFPLHVCMESESYELASKIIRGNPEVVNQLDDRGLTPLHIATLFHRPLLTFMKMLLLAGANPNIYLDDMHSTIYICKDDIRESRLFVRHDAFQDSLHYQGPNYAIWTRPYHTKMTVRYHCPERTTMLHILASRGHVSAVKLLLHHGADPQLLDSQCIGACCMSIHSLPMIHTFLKTNRIQLRDLRAMLDMLIKYELFQNAFIVAYMFKSSGLVESVEEAIGLSLQVTNLPNHTIRDLITATTKRLGGPPPLHVAIQISRHAFHALLCRGFDPSVIDKSTGNTLLHSLMLSRNIDPTLVPELKIKQDVNALNKDHCTVLHLAMKSATLGTVRSLLNDTQYPFLLIDQQDKTGNTALHLALEYGRDLEIVRCLALSGANTRVVNRSHESPLAMALRMTVNHDRPYVDAILSNISSPFKRKMVGYVVETSDMKPELFEVMYMRYSILFQTDLDQALVILKKNRQKEHYFRDGMSVLTVACLYGLSSVIQYMLDTAFCNRHNYVWNPVIAASISGSIDILNLVLDHMTKTDACIPVDQLNEMTQCLGQKLWHVTFHDGRIQNMCLNALHESVARGHLQCLDRLLPLYDLTAFDELDRNVVHWAAMTRNRAVVDIVVHHILENYDEVDQARIFFQCSDNLTRRVILLENPSENYMPRPGMSAFDRLIASGNIDYIHVVDKPPHLLAPGPDLLYQLAFHGHIVELLQVLKTGQISPDDLTYCDNKVTYSPFMILVLRGKQALAPLWNSLDYDTRMACFTHRTRTGLSVFHIAGTDGLPWLLSECPFDVSPLLWQDKFGRVPLHYATSTRLLHSLHQLPRNIIRTLDSEALQLFLHCDAINVKDNRNFTPLKYACMYGNITLVRLLLDKGAEVDRPDLVPPMNISLFPCDILCKLVHPDFSLKTRRQWRNYALSHDFKELHTLL